MNWMLELSEPEYLELLVELCNSSNIESSAGT